MARALGDSRQDKAGVYITVGLVMALVCSAFAAAASWVVAYLYFAGSFGDSPGFGLRILVKAIAFTVAAGACLWVVAKRIVPPAGPDSTIDVVRSGSKWSFIPAALLAALLLFSNLDRHPWPAPDELHHLIVARNLAAHGAYASGLAPDLVWFDRYDSVGAPVIGLVAGAFKLFGVGIASARGVLASFGVALTILVYFVFLPLYGARASGLASFLALAAFGTIYLSRSLYGEVPALAFVLLGLLAWRRGLRRGGFGLLMAAGLCFGLAILTKAFIAADRKSVV